MYKVGNPEQKNRPAVTWSLRGLAVLAILLLHMEHLQLSGTFLIDADESGYIDMIHEAGAPDHSWLWNVRSYFYPLILHIAARLLPCHPDEIIEYVQLYQMTSLALSSFTLLVVYALGRIWKSESAGLCGALLLAGNPIWLESASHVMMEAPFSMFTLMVIGCSSRLSYLDRHPCLLGAASGVMLGAAFMTKFDGLVMIPLTGLFLFIITSGHRNAVHARASFAGALFMTLCLCMALDVYYWESPFESLTAFYQVNFVEQVWTDWYKVRLSTLTRLADLRYATGGILVLPLAFAGVTWLIRIAKPAGLYVAGFIVVWLGIRLGSFYYLERFWVVLLPTTAWLTGIGLVWGIETLHAKLGKTLVPIQGPAIMGAVTLLLILARLDPNHASRRFDVGATPRMLEAGSAAIHYAETQARSQNIRLRVACISPVLLPRSMSPLCDVHQFYHPSGLSNANPQTFDLILISSRRDSSAFTIPKEFQEAEWGHASVISLLCHETLARDRIVWRKNPDSFRIHSGGVDAPIGWSLETNDKVEDSIHISVAGRYRITLMAQGEGGPSLTLRLGQHTFVWDNIPPAISVWSQELTLEEGTYPLIIAYTHDSETRNIPGSLGVGVVTLSKLHQPLPGNPTDVSHGLK